MKSVLHLARQRAPLLLLAMALMILTLAASLLGLLVDERVLTGAPAWLKPAKFSASVAIYTATVAWILTVLPAERGLRRAGDLMGVLLIVEVALIVLQVGRGTTSHFNVATPFDASLFRLMGGVIATVMLATMYVLWRAARVALPDAGLAAAIRWGLTISILGGWLGAVMTVPNRAQREAMAAGQDVSFQGGHAVGATEDGPGLPLVRRSTTGGDLRVPHFVGLHAMQLLPLALLLRRRHSGPGPTDPPFIRGLALGWVALVELRTESAGSAKRLLEHFGFNVICASDGQEAINRSASTRTSSRWCCSTWSCPRQFIPAQAADQSGEAIIARSIGVDTVDDSSKLAREGYSRYRCRESLQLRERKGWCLRDSV